MTRLRELLDDLSLRARKIGGVVKAAIGSNRKQLHEERDSLTLAVESRRPEVSAIPKSIRVLSGWTGWQAGIGLKARSAPAGWGR